MIVINPIMHAIFYLRDKPIDIGTGHTSIIRKVCRGNLHKDLSYWNGRAGWQPTNGKVQPTVPIVVDQVHVRKRSRRWKPRRKVGAGCNDIGKLTDSGSRRLDE